MCLNEDLWHKVTVIFLQGKYCFYRMTNAHVIFYVKPLRVKEEKYIFNIKKLPEHSEFFFPLKFSPIFVVK